MLHLNIHVHKIVYMKCTHAYDMDCYIRNECLNYKCLSAGHTLVNNTCLWNISLLYPLLKPRALVEI